MKSPPPDATNCSSLKYRACRQTLEFITHNFDLYHENYYSSFISCWNNYKINDASLTPWGLRVCFSKTDGNELRRCRSCSQKQRGTNQCRSQRVLRSSVEQTNVDPSVFSEAAWNKPLKNIDETTPETWFRGRQQCFDCHWHVSQ